MSRQHDPQSSSGSTGSSLSWEVEQVLTGHKYSRASLDSDSRARVGWGGVSGGVLALVLALEEGGVGAPVVQSWEDGAVVWTSSLIVSCGPAGLLQVLLKDLHWRPAAALQHRLTWHHVIHISEHLLKCFRKEWAEALKDSSTGSGALAPLLLSTAACVHCTAAPCTFRTTSTAAEGFYQLIIFCSYGSCFPSTKLLWEDCESQIKYKYMHVTYNPHASIIRKIKNPSVLKM